MSLNKYDMYDPETGETESFYLASDVDALREGARERVAAYAHATWSGWMRYQEQKAPGFWDSLPIELARRWRRQMNTPYQMLPESERESDREEADRILAAIFGEVEE